MSKSKRLDKRQTKVLDELFTGELDEQEILKKHNVSRNVYNRWLANGDFAESGSGIVGVVAGGRVFRSVRRAGSSQAKAADRGESAQRVPPGHPVLLHFVVPQLVPSLPTMGKIRWNWKAS